MVEEEVVQFVWTYEIFGLLMNGAVSIGGDKLGRYRSIDNVEKSCFRSFIYACEGNPLDKVLDKCLGNGGIDTIV